VGTERKPVIVKTSNYYFVAPLNGLLDLVLKEEKIEKTIQISNPKYLLRRINNTFHGRDIFAPVSAYISKGVAIENFGEEIEYQYLLNFPNPIIKEKTIEGEIIYFDKFGNAVTNIPCGRYKHCYYRNFKGEIKNNFLEGYKNKPNFICGSFGFIELFLPLENFQNKFKAQKGEKIICELREN
jgi:S-adenosylmethionine hydrolase